MSLASAPELRDIEEESRCPPIEAPEFGEVICEPALNQDTKTASLGTVCSFKCDDRTFLSRFFLFCLIYIFIGLTNMPVNFAVKRA